MRFKPGIGGLEARPLPLCRSTLVFTKVWTKRLQFLPGKVWWNSCGGWKTFPTHFPMRSNIATVTPIRVPRDQKTLLLPFSSSSFFLHLLQFPKENDDLVDAATHLLVLTMKKPAVVATELLEFLKNHSQRIREWMYACEVKVNARACVCACGWVEWERKRERESDT